jgi:hypothetical protein
LFNVLVEKDKEIQRYDVSANPTGQSQEFMNGYAEAVTKFLGAVFPLAMLEKQKQKEN